MFNGLLKALFGISPSCPEFDPMLESMEFNRKVWNFDNHYEIQHILEDISRYTQDNKRQFDSIRGDREAIFRLVEIITVMNQEMQIIKKDLEFNEKVLCAIFGDEKTRKDFITMIQKKSSIGNLHLAELFNKVLKLGE